MGNEKPHAIKARVAGLTLLYVHVEGMDDIPRPYTLGQRVDLSGEEIEITKWTITGSTINIEEWKKV